MKNGNIAFKHQILLGIITPISMIVAILLTYFFVDQFAVKESKVNVSIDLMKLISDIQPNVSIKLQKEIGSEENQLILNFDFYNSGPYPVFVDGSPKLSLFIPMSEKMVTEDKELIEGKDYRVVQAPIKRLSPKQNLTHSVGVIIDKNISKSRYFYGLSVTLNTDSGIQKLSEKLLSDFLSKDDITSLSKGSFYAYGLLLP